MITSCQFMGVSGSTIDLDTDDIPLTTFDITTDTRREDRDRPTQHGQFPTRQYFGKMLIHMEGSLFADDSVSYWTKRVELMRAFVPRPDLGNTIVGTLVVKFDGISETVQADCSLDGKPTMPLAALFPAGSDLLIQLQSDDPYWFSNTLYSAATGTPGSVTVGFSFNFSFPFVFGGGGSATTVNVTNGGNAPAYPIIKITGPCVNPSVTKDVFDLSFNGLTLAPTEYVTIDFKNRTAITNNGASAYGLITDTSHWWVLDPGVNSVKYSAFSASSPSAATISWRNTYAL